MRLKLVLFAAVALAGIARPAAAIEYPWCAQYSGDDTGGGRNCGFFTHEQCRATVSGIGGFCEPNLWSRPAILQTASENVSASAGQHCTATLRASAFACRWCACCRWS
jgi:hypothetical protein